MIVGALHFLKAVEEDIYQRVVKIDPAYGKLYDASKQWLERDDHWSFWAFVLYVIQLTGVILDSLLLSQVYKSRPKLHHQGLKHGLVRSMQIRSQLLVVRHLQEEFFPPFPGLWECVTRGYWLADSPRIKINLNIAGNNYWDIVEIGFPHLCLRPFHYSPSIRILTSCLHYHF